jgi:hypothetical protein
MRTHSPHKTALFPPYLIMLAMTFWSVSHAPLAHSESTSFEPALESFKKLQGEALHNQLVETAMRYDFYNKRCRGVSVSAEMEQVNRLFLRKFGMTLNNFIKQHIDRNPRNYQETVKQQLYQQIFELGGCEQAKTKGLVSRFQQEFRLLYEEAERSPWFPSER